MRPFAWLLVLVLLVAASSVRADEAVFLDGVAARVDDKVILVSDVRARARPGLAMRAALDEMIDAIVVAKEAKRSGIEATADEVRRARESLQQQNNFTREQLSAELRKQGMTEADWEARLREQLLEGKLLQLELAKAGKHLSHEPEIVQARDALLQKLRAAAFIEVRL